MELKRPFQVPPTDTASRDGGSGCDLLSSFKLNDQLILLLAFRPFLQHPVVVQQVLTGSLSGQAEACRLHP